MRGISRLCLEIFRFLVRFWSDVLYIVLHCCINTRSASDGSVSILACNLAAFHSTSPFKDLPCSCLCGVDAYYLYIMLLSSTSALTPLRSSNLGLPFQPDFNFMYGPHQGPKLTLFALKSDVQGEHFTMLDKGSLVHGETTLKLKVLQENHPNCENII